jgi:hypothetical protein
LNLGSGEREFGQLGLALHEGGVLAHADDVGLGAPRLGWATFGALKPE